MTSNDANLHTYVLMGVPGLFLIFSVFSSKHYNLSTILQLSHAVQVPENYGWMYYCVNSFLSVAFVVLAFILGVKVIGQVTSTVDIIMLYAEIFKQAEGRFFVKLRLDSNTKNFNFQIQEISGLNV